MVAKSVGRAIAGLLVFPPAALALGLGDIRLNSSLNSPLDAEIELIGATPEELSSLKAQIASRDTFERYGLEWPAHLGTIALSPARTPDGREVLRLRSSEAVTEPFVTLLVEVSWARGRLVREYTMLLDPPVYTPTQTAAAPVVAPSIGTEARGGTIERGPDAQTAPAESLAAAPGIAAPAVAPGAGESTYTVRRGDTLSGIASELAGGDRVEARRWMVALFQANPSAFDGNMNILRSGAVLRIPDAATVAAISASDAAAEVRRQYAAWRGAAPERSAVEEPGRLRLVTPSDASSEGVVAGTGADTAALQSRIQQLEAELQESRRLLELRNAELARLQRQLGEAPAAPVQQPATQEAEAELEIGAAPAETVAAAEAVAEATETAEPVDTPAVEEAPAAPVAAVTPAETAPAEAESSLFDTLKGLWWLIALLVAAVAGLLGLRAWRSKQQANLDDSLGRLAAAGAELAEQREPVISSTPVTRPAPAPREESFVVEESGVHERPAFASDTPIAAAARSVSVDDTLTGEVAALNDTAINLDQGDPLAEADFHMAYGLYDQAADLVRMAISREPERRDLKLKLLEVYFVWGNREQFLQTARELAETRDAAAPGEWEKIVIMGKQLAPEDPLFSGGAVSGAAAGGVDLDLEGGQNHVDFDLMGEPVPSSASVDLDIGSALGESPASDEISSTQATDTHFALDDSSADADSATGTTREMTAQITREMPAATGFAPTEMLPGFGEASDAPTVEQPALRSPDNPTIRQKVEMALRQSGVEQTAELAIDDLGLDLGALESTGELRGLDSDSDADAPTMVAGLDERSRQIMEEAERRAGETGTGTTFTATGSWNFDADELATQIAPSTAHEFQDQTLIEEAPAATDSSATSEIAGLQVSSDVDFDLGDINTALREANGNVDLDVGPTTPPADGEFAATQRLSADDLALPELEPVTMSEVGTKLDLARAYMDMGDPEGARNILEEVLQEGSLAQKQEAQRLIAALPG